MMYILLYPEISKSTIAEILPDPRRLSNNHDQIFCYWVVYLQTIVETKARTGTRRTMNTTGALIIFFLAGIHFGDPATDKDFKPVKIGKKTYYIETHEKMNWYVAQMVCGERGFELTSILNYDENQALYRHLKTIDIPGIPNFWIGGSEEGLEGEWVWLILGKKIEHRDYQNWMQVYGDGRDRNCMSAELTGGDLKWVEWFCGAKLYFICEKTCNEN